VLGATQSAPGQWHSIIWKNGRQVFTRDFSNWSNIRRIAFAKDGTMYAVCPGTVSEGCGLFKVYPNTGGFEPVVLQDSSSATFNTLFVDGNDVYVNGYDRDSNGHMFWVLWKNGKVQQLPVPDDWAQTVWTPLSVYVHDGIVYVAGWVHVLLSDSPRIYENRLCLWRDGKIETLYAENTGSMQRIRASSPGFCVW
jgi:hypothetical protein